MTIINDNLEYGKEYRYSLDNRRGANFIHICPNCGKREFKRYIDNTTMEYIAEDVGKCNRLIKCGFHKPPKVHFQEHPEEKTKRNELYRKKGSQNPQLISMKKTMI